MQLSRRDSLSKSFAVITLALTFVGTVSDTTFAQTKWGIIRDVIRIGTDINREVNANKQKNERQRLQDEDRNRRNAEQARLQEEQRLRQEKYNFAQEGARLTAAAMESFRLGDFETAERLLMRAESSYDRAGEAQRVNETRIYIGEMRFRRNNFSGALEMARSVLSSGQNGNDSGTNCRALLVMGLSQLGLKQNIQATETLRRALELAYMNTNNRGQIATALYGLGVALRNTGERAESINNLTRALTIAAEINDRKLGADILSTLTDYYVEVKNYPQAFSTLSNLMNLTSQFDQPRYIRTIIRYGNLKMQQRDYNEALTRFQEALRLSRQSMDIGAQALAHHQLGQLYLAKQNRREALNHLEQSLALYRDSQNTDAESQVLASITEAGKLPVTNSDRITSSPQRENCMSARGGCGTPKVSRPRLRTTPILPIG